MVKKVVKVQPDATLSWSLTRDGFTAQSGEITDVLTQGQVQAFLESSIGKFYSSSSTSWYIDGNGDLYGCGYNNKGQQGAGSTTDVKTFTKRASDVRDLYLLPTATFYISNSGDLYCCGNNDYNQQGTVGAVNKFIKRGSNVKKISLTTYTSWYIDGNGDLYGCGRNNYGQQGAGSTTDVSTFTKRASNVKDVFSSQNTTWYLTNNGDLYGCGRNNYGQQGAGSTTDVKTFTKRASNVKDVYAGINVVWYLTNSGDLYGCGENACGQQGDGTTTNVTTFSKRASNVKSFVANNYMTLYLTNNDDMYGCGLNRDGQLGNGTTADITSFTKIASNVKSADLTGNNNAGTIYYITNSWDLYGGGYNEYGQLGNGTTADVTSFTKIASNVKKVKISTYSPWYTTNDNILYACGYNTHGQLGTGTNENATTPVKIAENVKDFWPGNTAWYMDKNGDMYGCGDNDYGQLGDGTTTEKMVYNKVVEGLGGYTANLTINPTPADATVLIDGDELSTKEVAQGKLVEYTVKKTLYKTVTGTTRIYGDETLNIVMEEEEWEQKEDMSENGVTFRTEGSYAVCSDAKLAKAWKNGYDGVVTRPSQYSSSDYPSIGRSSSGTGLSRLIVILPKELTLQEFKVLLIRYTANSYSTISVDVKDEAGNVVYTDKRQCSQQDPIIFSNSGSFKAKTIELYDGSTNGDSFVGQMILYSLIVGVEK